MFLSFKLLTLELKRNGCWKIFLQYRKFLQKLDNHNLRIGFLNNCLKSKIIPRFLKFRVPKNGCFDDRAVHEFQVKLLRKEIYNAGRVKNSTSEKLIENRKVETAITELLHTFYHSTQPIRYSLTTQN